MQINPDGIAIAAAQPGPKPVIAAVAPAVVPQAAPNRESVRQAAEATSKVAKAMVNSLEFSVDEQTGKTIVRVVDGGTQQLIRQIPSEEMLAIAKSLDRFQGLLLRSKA